EALSVPEGPIKDALGLLSGASAGPSTVSLRAAGRLLRLTLHEGPGDTVIATAEDLGEAERWKREAARAREHLAKVLRSVDDAILTLDADGRIASGNDAVGRVLGISEAEARGKEATWLCADERSVRRAAAMRLQLRSSGFAEGELRLKRKQGGSFAAEV